MPRPDRHQHFLDLLASGPRTIADLAAASRPPLCDRQVRRILGELRRAHPGRIRAEPDGRLLRWRYVGDTGRPLPQPIAALDEDQIAALIAARGILRQSDPARPAAEDAGDAYHGALATALDRLLHQAGLAAEAKAIAPDAVTVSRFGVAREEDAAFPICLAAIRTGDSLRCTYTKQNGETKAVHIQPIRLVHIAGEWHCFAWCPDPATPPGRIKQYRLSAMTAPERSGTPVPDCPQSGLSREVTDILSAAFKATGSIDPKHRRRVRLAISPIAWHFMRDRRWGANQQIAGPGLDGLPADWRRIEFTTTGLNEARHFILSLGSEASAEGPPELIAWLREQGAYLAKLGAAEAAGG